MPLLSLYNLVVPCRGDIREKGSDIFASEKRFCLNSRCLVREEPEGFLVIPPGMMTDFIYLDSSFSPIFEEESFSLSGYLSDDVDRLLSLGIVKEYSRTETEGKAVCFHVGVGNLPVHALLDVTAACNCNCLSCYHKNDLDGYSPGLSDIKERIDKLKDLGVMVIEVTGGEPFLRKDLTEILEYIKSKGLLFYLVTNGEFLLEADDLLIAAIKRGNGLAISLDGYGDVHDNFRRRYGLFEKVVRGLDLCSKNDIPVVLVSTLNENNYESIPGMLSLSRRYNGTLHLRPTIRTGAAVINEIKDNYPVDKIRDFLKEKNVRNGFLGERRKVLFSCKYYGCGLRWRISVDVHGLIFPCVMDRSRNIGPISEFSQKELFDALAKEAGHFLSQHKQCRSCERFAGREDDPGCSGFCRFSKSYKNNIYEG